MEILGIVIPVWGMVVWAIVGVLIWFGILQLLDGTNTEDQLRPVVAFIISLLFGPVVWFFLCIILIMVSWDWLKDNTWVFKPITVPVGWLFTGIRVVFTFILFKPITAEERQRREDNRTQRRTREMDQLRDTALNGNDTQSIINSNIRENLR